MKFLVVDIGSSICRAAVVSGKGAILSQSRCPVSIKQTRPSYSEIDLDRLWHSIQKLVRSEADKHTRAAFDAIGVSAMLGYVFLDSTGQPLLSAITYADNRAAAETEEIRRLFPEDQYTAITGRHPSPLLLAPKIKWLAKNRPDVTDKMRHIIGLKDEIVRRLSGTIQTDMTHLDYSGLYNVYEKKLDPELLELLNIDAGLFGAPAKAIDAAGTLTAEAAGALNIAAGTPIVVGSSDGTTAMYGAGVLDSGTAILVSGTTDVLMTCSTSKPDNPSRELCINSGILPGTYLIGGPLGLSGGCLRYFERLLQTSAVVHEHEISRLPPGSDGLLIFPGLTGERSPYWKSYLTGSIAGLTPDHTREHILRAVKEGCALRLVKLLDILTKNGLQPRVLNVAGGGADSDAWNQIRADATGLVVQKMAVAEATCLGTAIFCQTAVDKTRSIKEISGEWIKVAKRFKPLPEHTAAYQRFSRLFETYVESNSVLFQELDECRRQVDSDKKL